MKSMKGKNEKKIRKKDDNLKFGNMYCTMPLEYSKQ